MLFDEVSGHASGIYRCVDPIDNLRIRVIVQPKAGRATLPFLTLDFDKTISSSQLSDITEDNSAEGQDYIFKWQEKVFSQNEIKKYSDLSNCKTKLHEKYHAEVTELKNEKKEPGLLYTYVDVDGFHLRDDCNVVSTSSDHVSKLAKHMKHIDLSGTTSPQYKNIAKRNVVRYTPSSDFCQSSHFLIKNMQRMFIMINLRTDSGKVSNLQENNNDELVLCRIAYNLKTHVLEVTPAFMLSLSVAPYQVKLTKGEDRALYYFWVLHASKDITDEERHEETEMLDKISQHQVELRGLEAASHFSMSSLFRVTVLLEITSCHNFDSDNLFVHYTMLLPRGWQSDDTLPLSGCTHSSHVNADGVAYFSHLLQLSLTLDRNLSADDTESPEMCFEVVSLDKWSCFSSEGYTRLALPSDPGVFQEELLTWRALSEGMTSRMQRFFIGGGSELQNVRYISAHSQAKEGLVSRFGLRTVPSGSIQVRLNVLHQSEDTRLHASGHLHPRMVSGAVVHKGNVKSLLGSVNAALEAFRKARERMLQVKQGLQVEGEGSK